MSSHEQATKTGVSAKELQTRVVKLSSVSKDLRRLLNESESALQVANADRASTGQALAETQAQVAVLQNTLSRLEHVEKHLEHEVARRFVVDIASSRARSFLLFVVVVVVVVCCLTLNTLCGSVWYRKEMKAAQQSAAQYVFVLRKLLRKAQVKVEADVNPRRTVPVAEVDSQTSAGRLSAEITALKVQAQATLGSYVAKAHITHALFLFVFHRLLSFRLGAFGLLCLAWCTRTAMLRMCVSCGPVCSPCVLRSTRQPLALLPTK